MRQRAVRMVDVAELAGVSQTTASFVLNERPVAIPEETRRRVMDAAAQLGYRANRIARTLASSRSGLLGAVLPEALHGCALDASRKGVRQGYRLLTEPAGPGLDAFHGAIERLLDWRVEGVLIWWDGALPASALERWGDTPIACVGLASPPAHLDAVWTDEGDGVRRAVRYLRALGHTELCHVRPDGGPFAGRAAAVRATLAVAGMAPAIECECTGGLAAEACDAVAGVLAEHAHPTAIICDRDDLAMGALRAIRDAGMDAPGDISVLALEDSGMSAMLQPAVTALDYRVEALVGRAMDYLLERVCGSPGGAQRLMVTPALAVRESTAPPPQGTPWTPHDLG